MMIALDNELLQLVHRFLSLCSMESIHWNDLYLTSGLTKEELQEYLSYLLARDLLANVQAGIYTLTAKGQDFLFRLDKIMDILGAPELSGSMNEPRFSKN